MTLRRQRFLQWNTKSLSHKRKNNLVFWTYSKLRISALQITSLREYKTGIYWEKVFANHIFNKELLSKKFSELRKHSASIFCPILKIDSKGYFTERCQISTYLKFVRPDHIKCWCWWAYRMTGILTYCWWENCPTTLENSLTVS